MPQEVAADFHANVFFFLNSICPVLTSILDFLSFSGTLLYIGLANIGFVEILMEGGEMDLELYLLT